MSKSRPHRKHLSRSSDLETTYEATRAGFVALALEKNRRATPAIAEARALKVAASAARSPEDLLKNTSISAALLTAAGVSNKAAAHVKSEDKEEAIRGLVEEFLEPAGAAFVEELVYRFLLTKGDALGGAMRNLGGAIAQRKFTEAVVATLKVAGSAYQWLDSDSQTWLFGDRSTFAGGRARALGWRVGRRPRTLLYNLRIPLVGNNVDLCLFDCDPKNGAGALTAPPSYLALGELKGGIDPAGADEHWKTTNTALSRIRSAFSKQGAYPKTFLLAAAIEKKMAAEIWTQLEDGTLSNAANITDAHQLNSLCAWLVSL